MSKLWIDDMRDAPDDSWTVVRKVQPAINFLRHFQPEVISFDHDIDNRPDDETFMPIVYYVVALQYLNPPEFRIHTDNPVAARAIQEELKFGYQIDVPWTPYTSQADFAKKYGLE